MKNLSLFLASTRTALGRGGLLLAWLLLVGFSHQALGRGGPLVNYPANSSNISSGPTTITGSSTASDDVDVYVNSIFEGTATADGAGNWSFPFAFANGSHSVYVVSNGCGCGSPTNTFTVGPAASSPTVSTAAPSSVGSTSAVLGGDVTADGGATVTDRGVVYCKSSNSTNPGIGDSGVTQDANGTGTGAFSATVSGLFPGLSYSVRAYATNSAGTSYGSAVSFTTTVPPPTATPTLNTPANGSASNNPNPTYSGTAAAGSNVTVYLSNGSLYPTTATPGGTFSVTPSTGLSDGTRSVYVTAQSSGAGVSANSNTNTFTVDTALPFPTISTTAGASGGSTSTTPMPFSVSFTENVTGFAANDLVVTNGTVSGFAGSGSVYSFSVTPTANGSVSVGFPAGVCQDAAGNGCKPGNFSITYTAAITLSTWTGSAGTTDWFAPGNWSAGVPTTAVDVVVASGAARYPFLTTGSAVVRNVTVNAGATLGMSGGVLNISGNLANNGTFVPTGGAVSLSGTSNQTLGGSSLTRFWDLNVGTPGATLSSAAAVQRVLNLKGNLTTNGQTFTLESSAAGTALVMTTGGAVTGNATVQRYITADLIAGAAYRHFSSPVGAATVGGLATGSFTPMVNASFNTSAAPGGVRPFPTVQGYDQARLATAVNNLSAFDKGWFSPTALSNAMTPGRGYTVNIAAAQAVAFVGQPTTGDLTMPLARNSGATTADAGWHLLGNPYASPLDYSLVAAADRPNLDGTIYVYEASSQYGGVYRLYQPAAGSNPAIGDKIVAMGQAFFARVSTGQTSGSLTFRNSQRVTAYQNPVFHREAADARPLVQLTLQGTTGPADKLHVYFAASATAGFDSQLDAVKLPNPNGLNLSAEAAGQQLAINGLPLLGSAALTVPLQVRVPATGTYTLTAAQLLNLTTTPTYLRDRQTGTLVNLATQPRYTFTQNAANTAARFELVFSPQRALATAAASLTEQVAVFPNPATGTAFVELPAGLRTAATADLVDALGRMIRTFALPAGLSTHALVLDAVAAGVYSLRVNTTQGTVTKKLVVE